MRERDCSLTTRWTPAHRGVEDNEIADTCAKWGAHGPDGQGLPQGGQPCPSSKKNQEAKTKSTRDWIRRHVRAERRHCHPKGGKIRRTSRRRTRELPADTSSSSLVGPYLAEITKTIRPDKCWWCNSGERQSRHRLFVKCRAREAQIKESWRRVGKACEWNTPERQLSSYSSRTKKRLRRSCNPCGTLRSEGWLL